jgi:uncharacterized repeat protein (TIGR01451 family)
MKTATMKTSNLKASLLSISRLTFIILLSFFISFVSKAQSRNYSIVYSDNIKGSCTLFGNTLMQIIDNGTVNTLKMNDNSANGNSMYGNNHQNMQYADIDGNTGNGSVTRNSSSAELSLPSGTNTIKLARLYWGGFVVNSEFDLTAEANRKIKIRKGTTDAYLNVTALGLDKNLVNNIYSQYQAYADITNYVKDHGDGTYEVGNAPLSAGNFSISGANGGWCIAVIYQNDDLNYNSVRLYDGFKQIFSSDNSPFNTVDLSGLDVPSGALQPGDAKMGVVSWEGDANLKTDFLKINGNLFSNATNESDNPWNGTITDNGQHVTTKNPNYTNQMGIDIDQFDVGTGYGITPSDTSVRLQFGAEEDRYFPGLFTFVIKMKDPVITLDKTVVDATNDHRGEVNEVLTYTLKGKNSGQGNANSVVITDTLPSTVTYVPNSLKVVSSPGIVAGIKTDASGDDVAEFIQDGSIKTVRFRLGRGATSTAGGTLDTDESYEVEFKVTVNDPGSNNPVPSIINYARVKAVSDAHVPFVDDGTAIINPDAGPLPVTLVSFAATLLQDGKVKVNWSTSMEINCSGYKVERSEDGKIFYEISSVPGNGTTSSMHSYSSIDDVSSVTGSIAYYRLKQLDIDNKKSYSKIIALKLKKTDKLIAISPNPFSSYININMEWSKKEVIIAKVINIQGKEVVSKNIELNKGLNYISINELSRLPAGNYFLQFISSTERFIRNITKQ